MKLYLIYLIKNKWLQTLVMALIPTLIFLISVLMNTYRYYHELIPGRPTFRTPDVFASALVFIMILIPIVTIFRLYIFRNSKDVDLYYSLPVSRQQLLLTQLFFGFIQLLFIWTTMYFIGLIAFSILTDGSFLTGYLLLLYFVTIFYIAVLYGITSYLFLKANTLVDGIAFIIIFHTAFLFLSTFLASTQIRMLGFIHAFMFNPFYSISQLTYNLLYISRPDIGGSVPITHSLEIPHVFINSLIFVTLSIFGFILSYQSIRTEKSENIGRLSLSKIGYKSLIPLNLLFISASTYTFFYSTSFIAIAIIAAAGFIGYFIMRRSVKITWVDIASVVTPIIIAIIYISIMR
jgi:hypothetical protein